MVDIIKHKDFSLSPEPVTFTIAPDTFECVPEIPLDALSEMTSLATKSSDTSDQLKKVYDLFDSVMTPESAALFRKRGKKGTEENPNLNPIGMRHIKEILPWLMEVYGLRPTQLSDSSLDGLTDDDGSSTDGA